MFKAIIKKAFSLAGYRIMRLKGDMVLTFPSEFSKEDQQIFNYVRRNNLSIVSDERLFATLMACQYVAMGNVEGDFVECGVYRGGNSIIAADVYRRSAPYKSVWLFDTYAGMSNPTDIDVSSEGVPAKIKYLKNQREPCNKWQYAAIEEVRAEFAKVFLLTPNVRFVKGDVLNTLCNGPLPDKISVLRLDTDWYESTKLELEVLYPRLVSGGVLIIDDYGSWAGSRKAVDEYFSNFPRPFLQCCDYSRVGVKYEEINRTQSASSQNQTVASI